MSAAVWANNISNSSATGIEPFEVLFGQEPHLPMDNLLQHSPVMDEALDISVEKGKNKMKQMSDLINARTKGKQNRRKSTTLAVKKTVFMRASLCGSKNVLGEKEQSQQTPSIYLLPKNHR